MKEKGGSPGSSEEISAAMFLFIEQIQMKRHRKPHTTYKSYILYIENIRLCFFLHFDEVDLR